MLQHQKANSVLTNKRELLNHRKRMQTPYRSRTGYLLPLPFQICKFTSSLWDQF